MSVPVIVICGPPENIILPGSKMFKCVKCGAECSCSPTGQKVITEENGLVYCPDCGKALYLDQLKAGKKPEIHQSTYPAFIAALYLKAEENN